MSEWNVIHERQRNRDRQRQRKRDRDTERQRHTHRDRDRETERQRQRERGVGIATDHTQLATLWGTLSSEDGCRKPILGVWTQACVAVTQLRRVSSRAGHTLGRPHYAGLTHTYQPDTTVKNKNKNCFSIISSSSSFFVLFLFLFVCCLFCFLFVLA